MRKIKESFARVNQVNPARKVYLPPRIVNHRIVKNAYVGNLSPVVVNWGGITAVKRTPVPAVMMTWVHRMIVLPVARQEHPAASSAAIIAASPASAPRATMRWVKHTIV
jgi:hypothetical protein